MRLLHVTHPSGFNHDTGTLHPERPARLRAVYQGVAQSGVEKLEVEAEPLSRRDLTVVHDAGYVEAIRRFCAAGGGDLDADTPVSEGSWEAALAAAGAGPTAVERLSNGFEGPAFISVRPPGHHALRDRAMGFCLFNNVAITAARLMHSGSRVAIVDWDVHHGNGTQDIFYEEPAVLYASIHQSPFYPYQGNPTELGAGGGVGATLNVPLPAFTAGDVYLEAFEGLVITAVKSFEPDWLLVSSGFDAHAHDPLAEFRLTELDYARMASELTELVPANRIVAFLEGGYHLPALRDSTAAVIRSLVGLSNDLEPSPFRSPEVSSRALERVKGAVSGYVPGVV